MLSKKGIVLIAILSIIILLLAFFGAIAPVDGIDQPFNVINFIYAAGEIVIWIFCILMIFFLYFLPAFNASNRKHNNFAAITVLNIFLGWTFLGWLIALIWSFTDNVQK